MVARSVRIAFKTLGWIARAALVSVTLFLLVQNSLDLSRFFTRAIKAHGAVPVCSSTAARPAVIRLYSTPAVQMALAHAEPAHFGTPMHRLPTQSKYAR